MESSRLGILGAGPNQMPLILKATQANLEFMTIDGTADRVGHLFSSVEPVIVDLAHPALVASRCMERDVRAVATLGSDLAASAARYCRQRGGLLGVQPPEGLNKLEQLRLFERIGVLAPQYKIINGQLNDIYDMAKVSRSWGRRLSIIKPLAKWGSLGISVVRNASEALAVNDIIQGLDLVAQVNGGPIALIEEFLEGDELGVSVSVASGQIYEIGVTRKVKPSGDWRSYGHFPIGYWRESVHVDSTFDQWAELIALLHRICVASTPGRAYSLDLDVMYSEGHLYVLEYAYRSGGHAIGLVLDETYGSNFVSFVLFAGASSQSDNNFLTSSNEGLMSRSPDSRSVSVVIKQSRLARAIACGIDEWTLSHIFLASPNIGSSTHALSIVNKSILVMKIPFAMTYQRFRSTILPKFTTE